MVVIEPPNAFLNNTLAVQATVLDNIGHLLPKVVPSSVGAMYLRFASWEDRREALGRQPFMHEEARIDLFPEETYDRIAPRLDMCAVLAATGFPAEFITPICVPAMFSGFGKVHEIDPLVLSGRELATLRAVVLLKNPRAVPCDVWPLGGRWGTRIVAVRPVVLGGTTTPSPPTWRTFPSSTSRRLPTPTTAPSSLGNRWLETSWAPLPCSLATAVVAPGTNSPLC